MEIYSTRYRPTLKTGPITVFRLRLDALRTNNLANRGDTHYYFHDSRLLAVEILDRNSKVDIYFLFALYSALNMFVHDNYNNTANLFCT